MLTPPNPKVLMRLGLLLFGALFISLGLFCSDLVAQTKSRSSSLKTPTSDYKKGTPSASNPDEISSKSPPSSSQNPNGTSTQEVQTNTPDSPFFIDGFICEGFDDFSKNLTSQYNLNNLSDERKNELEKYYEQSSCTYIFSKYGVEKYSWISPDDLPEMKEKLKRSGYFESIDMIVIKSKLPQHVFLKLILKTKNSQSFDIQVGATQLDKVRGADIDAKYSWYNHSFSVQSIELQTKPFLDGKIVKLETKDSQSNTHKVEQLASQINNLNYIIGSELGQWGMQFRGDIYSRTMESIKGESTKYGSSFEMSAKFFRNFESPIGKTQIGLGAEYFLPLKYSDYFQDTKQYPGYNLVPGLFVNYLSDRSLKGHGQMMLELYRSTTSELSYYKHFLISGDWDVQFSQPVFDQIGLYIDTKEFYKYYSFKGQSALGDTKTESTMGLKMGKSFKGLSGKDQVNLNVESQILSSSLSSAEYEVENSKIKGLNLMGLGIQYGSSIKNWNISLSLKSLQTYNN